jgi:hypothetical protein
VAAGPSVLDPAGSKGLNRRPRTTKTSRKVSLPSVPLKLISLGDAPSPGQRLSQKAAFSPRCAKLWDRGSDPDLEAGSAASDRVPSKLIRAPTLLFRHFDPEPTCAVPGARRCAICGQTEAFGKWRRLPAAAELSDVVEKLRCLYGGLDRLKKTDALCGDRLCLYNTWNALAMSPNPAACDLRL